MKKYTHLYITIFTLIFSSQSFANVRITTLNKQADVVLQQGKHKLALSLLEQQIRKKVFDNQTLFLLSMTHKEMGHTKTAIKYFERLLEIELSNRARLELGELYLKDKQTSKAKKQFEIVKAHNPPQNVQLRIDGYLQQIAYIEQQHSKKNWDISASAGYLHDTNANAGTTENTVLLFNLPFVLSDDAKQTSDDAMKYNFGLGYNKELGKSWQVFSNVGLANTNYKTLNNFDLLSMYASSGIAYKRKNITYSLPLAFNRLTVGHTENYYNYTYGLNPSVRIAIGKNMIFNNQFVIQQREYKSVTGRNGNNITYRPNFQYYFAQGHFLGIGGSVGRDSVEADINSNTAYSVGLQYGKTFFQKWNLFLSPSFSNTSYKAKENAFNELREDKMYSFYSQIYYDFKGRRGLKPRLSLYHSYSKNDSNLSLYSYTRQQVGVDLVVGY
jgi:tetratricopeptide (TPR) repeat protein